MKFKELECEFDYQGASYAACADVDVLTEEKDIGPQGHHEHYLAQVPVEASVDDLQIYNNEGDRLQAPAPELVAFAYRELEDLAFLHTYNKS